MVKEYFSFFAIICAFVCCNETGKAAAQNRETKSATEITDTATAEWLKTKNLKNTIFVNNIKLADGQEADAGLSFLLQTDTTPVIVSAMHLLGPAAGFSKTIELGQVSETVTAWNLSSVSTGESIETNGEAIDATGDALLLKLPREKNTSSLVVMKLSKVAISQNNEISLQAGSNTYKVANEFYLIGYDASSKEVLYPLQFVGIEEGYHLFRKKREFAYRGLSGGPIVDSKGGAFAILTGGYNKDGEEVILGSKIELPAKR